MPRERPPQSVVRSFGSGQRLHRLLGGQGTSWKAGDLVLKPSEGPVHPWLGETFGGLVLEGVRVSVPVASSDGRWVVDGWGAASFVVGSEPDLSLPSTWLGVIEAGRAFHSAIFSHRTSRLCRLARRSLGDCGSRGLGRAAHAFRT